MSELKARRAYFSEDEYERGAHKICAKVSDCGDDRKNDWWSYAFEDDVYIKSEADKVIDFWKNESHKHYENWFNLNKQFEGWFGKVCRCERAEREARYQKYKRCKAMANWCKDKINTIENGYMV